MGSSVNCADDCTNVIGYNICQIIVNMYMHVVM